MKKDALHTLKFSLILDEDYRQQLSDDGKIILMEIIIQLVKVEKNMRYCKNKLCKCHPEYQLLSLLKDKEILKFYETHNYDLTPLFDYLNSDYERITVFD